MLHLSTRRFCSDSRDQLTRRFVFAQNESQASFIKKYIHKNQPISEEVDVSIRFFFKTKRKRDLDNQNRLVLDALSGIVYEDDSQIAALHLFRDYDAAKPRIGITVSNF